MAALSVRRAILLMTSTLATPAVAQDHAVRSRWPCISPIVRCCPRRPAGRGPADIVVTGARLQAVKDIAAKRSIVSSLTASVRTKSGLCPIRAGRGADAGARHLDDPEQRSRRGAIPVDPGLNADYNLVEIDGVPLPANEISRRNVSLDVIPSSLASRVEVNKSMNAAMNGNAIGGVANLRTRSAFDNAASRSWRTLRHWPLGLPAHARRQLTLGQPN